MFSPPPDCFDFLDPPEQVILLKEADTLPFDVAVFIFCVRQPYYGHYGRDNISYGIQDVLSVLRHLNIFHFYVRMKY